MRRIESHPNKNPGFLLYLINITLILDQMSKVSCDSPFIEDARSSAPLLFLRSLLYIHLCHTALGRTKVANRPLNHQSRNNYNSTSLFTVLKNVHVSLAVFLSLFFKVPHIYLYSNNVYRHSYFLLSK